MKSALILIDIQNDYFPGGAMELAGMTQAAAQARELLDRLPAGPAAHFPRPTPGPGAGRHLLPPRYPGGGD